MIRLRRLRVILFASLLIGAALGGGGLARSAGTRAAPPAQAVGVTLNSGPGGEGRSFQLFLEAGSTAIEAPQPWRTLEPSRDRFRLGDVGALVGGVRSIPAMRILAVPAAVETTERSVPPDLQRAPWGSRRMIDRYRRLLRHLAPDLSRQVHYVSIANEADVYFSAHPDEMPGFLRFAGAEIADLHRLAPWVRVGVTVTYSGLTSAHPAIARALADLGDATILTYYPLAGGYRMRSPRAPLRDIPRMVRLAHGRPLVIQEAGYSTARRLGGSPSAQARFVGNVFAGLERFPRAIPFLSFYSLFDLPAGECRTHSDAVAFLCSLGLRYRNGHAKPAWAAFRAGAMVAP